MQPYHPPLRVPLGGALVLAGLGGRREGGLAPADPDLEEAGRWLVKSGS